MRLQVASDQLEVSEEVDARTIPGTVGDSLNHPFGVTDEIDSRIRWVGKPFRVGKACPYWIGDRARTSAASCQKLPSG